MNQTPSTAESKHEIEIYERKWPIGTRERLAFALLLYTAQRRADVVRMGRQHLRGNSLYVKQQKTGIELEIPLHNTLIAILDATPGNLTFLTTENGKPFSPAGFTNWFSETVAMAGLPKGLAPHGLRKAACRRLAERGCTVHQIMAISGHKSISEIQRYTKAADQKRLARGAVQAMQMPFNKDGK